MSSTLPPRSKLEALPAEIFEQTATSLDSRDLRALRMVSKECNCKTLRTFASVCMRDAVIVLRSETSMKMAFEISKHETFGPAIRSVTIYVDRHLLDPGATSLEDTKWLAAGSRYDGRTQSLECIGQTYFGLLVKTFECLRSKGHVQTVEVLLKKEQQGSGIGNYASTFGRVIKALAFSELCFEKLSMGSSHRGIPIHALQRFELDLTISAYAQVFGRVKHLSLQVIFGYFNDALLNHGIATFVSFIAAATDLESLTVSTWWRSRDDVAPLLAQKLLEDCTLPKLQSLWLDGFKIDLAWARTLSNRYMALRCLQLKNCRMDGASKWPSRATSRVDAQELLQEWTGVEEVVLG